MVLENVRDSVDTEALETLEEKKISERIPNHTDKVITVLKTDSNANLTSKVSSLVENNEGKLGLEEIANAIDIHVWDKLGKVLDIVRVGTDQKRNDIEKIEEETMNNLKPLCSDFSKIRTDIEEQTAENAY